MQNKVKTLKSLIRLHQQTLDLLRRKLAEEEADLGQALEQIASIDNEIDHEKKFAALSPDFMQSFTLFLQGAKYRRALQDYKRQQIEEQIEITRHHLREALSELKRYESAHAKILKTLEENERKREQKEMDEVGLRGFFVK